MYRQTSLCVEGCKIEGFRFIIGRTAVWLVLAKGPCGFFKESGLACLRSLVAERNSYEFCLIKIVIGVAFRFGVQMGMA